MANEKLKALPLDATDEEITLAKGHYCPFCRRVIYPSNVAEFMRGEANEFIYIHDDVEHDPDYDHSTLH